MHQDRVKCGQEQGCTRVGKDVDRGMGTAGEGKMGFGGVDLGSGGCKWALVMGRRALRL